MEEQTFHLGDYVFAEDWIYGKIVYLDNEYAEISFQTEKGNGYKTFSLTDLKHSETPKRIMN